MRRTALCAQPQAVRRGSAPAPSPALAQATTLRVHIPGSHIRTRANAKALARVCSAEHDCADWPGARALRPSRALRRVSCVLLVIVYICVYVPSVSGLEGV